MKLSIIIVTWKVKDKLRANLEALSRLAVDFDWEVFVVDNNSKDGTVEMVQENFPSVKLIVNQENLGFAKANNQCLKQATGDFILLLNPDMKVGSDTLKNLVSWLEKNPQAWVTGGKLIDENNKIIINVRHFPQFSDQLAIILKLPHIFPGIVNKYLAKDFDYAKPAQVDSVRGSFFAMRRECVEKVGLLDERFFVWFEEVDYCRRVYDAGGEVWYTPEAVCVDYVGQSFGQLSNTRTQAIFRASQLKYFKKWHSVMAVWGLKLAWAVSFLPTRLIVWLGRKSRAKT